ncbi:MAG TPA: TIGR03619 family F420-dependent LLM class oxidoreductase [bacterium]|nr:TIGR03619 family F420-dependent LLM class oxidoreductase [bacterium]HKJ92123.1 TIGR03619 family F420-dependent LLM class oxidoreductase [Longimicrobiales bacterium]
MKLGFSLPIAGAWATPENQVRVAQHAEALGYHSLWTFQRLLYAIEPQNDYPPYAGQPWPEAFRRVVDPIVTLAYVAAVTRRIRLGISVLIMPFYSPAMLAKQLATLDHCCGGRLDVGLGIGWSKDELEAVGVPYRERGRRGDEFMRCLKAIWTQDVAEFHGEFYQLPRSLIEPRPVQQPHPPITFGGYGSAAVRRAVALADGFMGGNVPLVEVEPLVAELKTAAQAAGRDVASLQIVARGTFRLYDTPQGEGRRPLWGTVDEIREDLDLYRQAGLTELFLEANFDPEMTLERALDAMTRLAPA